MAHAGYVNTKSLRKIKQMIRNEANSIPERAAAEAPDRATDASLLETRNGEHYTPNQDSASDPNAA